MNKIIIKRYKNRKEVPNKYKWDLDAILENSTKEELLKTYVKTFKKLIEIKDSKYNSKEDFIKGLKVEEKFYKIYFRIYNFASNKLNENILDTDSIKFMNDLEFTSYELNKELGPEKYNIFKNEHKIKKWLQDYRLKDYINYFHSIFEEKKHELPKQIQEFQIKSSIGNIEAKPIFSILTDSELNYGYARNSNGKKIKITSANISVLVKNKDFNIRKSAINNYRQAYLDHKDSLSNLLYQHFRNITIGSKIKKYKNVISYLIYPDRASEKIITTLYKTVQNHLFLAKKSKSIHKKVYKLVYKKPITQYDYELPLIKTKEQYSIEEMQEHIINAFAPFGKEYINVIKRAFKERWIDYMSIENKRSGAYSIGESYSLNKKYILMNYDGQLRSMETLAHELGHSMHSYFSDINNKLVNSQYTIFVAEIASIFNELMLFDWLLKNSNSDKLKFKIRKKMIEGFEATVFRQVEWSNYEYDLYKAIEKGKSFSNYDAISRLYFENHKKYSLKKNPKYDPKKQYSAIRVPHFYCNFYVYKYAIGQLVANIFFQRYLEKGSKVLKEYIAKFLSKGSTMKPIELLKYNGINLEEVETYNKGFMPYFDNINKLNELTKKIFK